MAIVIQNLETSALIVTVLPRRASEPAASGCCGGAAPSGTDGCCALDADVKASGGSGCGCNAVAEH